MGDSGYVAKVLGESVTRPGARARTKRFVDAVACAHCRGTGVDPKWGEGSRCPVCGATGAVRVASPVVTCLRCAGSGRDSGDLSCLACRGVGVVSVHKDAGPCRRCGGTGQDGVFYCTPCRGQGIA